MSAGIKNAARRGEGPVSALSVLLLALMVMVSVFLVVVQNVSSLSEYFGSTTLRIVTDVALLLFIALFAAYIYLRSTRYRRELEAMVERLQRSNLLLQVLNSIQSSANSTLDAQMLLQLSLETVMPQISSTGVVYLLDESDSRLKAKASCGLKMPLREMPDFALGEGLVGGVAATGEAIEEGSLGEEPGRKGAGGQPRFARIAIPIKAGSKIMGVLVSSTSGRAYSEEEKTLLHAITEVLGNSLTNAKLYDITRRALDATRRTQSYLEGFIGETRIGVVVTDEQGRLMIANAEAERFLRAQPRELQGRNALEWLEARGERGAPLARALRNCYELRQGTSFMQPVDDDPIRPAARIDAFPLMRENGEVIGAAATIIAH